MILSSGDEEQRRAIRSLKVHLGRTVRVEHCERAFPEHVRRGRDTQLIVDLTRFRDVELVREIVVELFLRDRHGGVVCEGVTEDRQADAKCRERQHRNSRWLCGVDKHTGGAEASIDEHLHEQTAKRVAHENWWRGQPADDPLVVIDDRFHREALERRRVTTDRFDLALESGPRRSEHGVAGALITFFPPTPASGSQPEPVNQNDGRPGRRGVRRTHGVSPKWLVLRGRPHRDGDTTLSVQRSRPPTGSRRRALHPAPPKTVRDHSMRRRTAHR